MAAKRSPDQLEPSRGTLARAHDVSASTTPNLTVRVGVATRELVVVALCGEFDSSDVDAFERFMAGVRVTRPRRIVIDLSELQFLAASALHPLHDAADDVVLARPRGIVQRVLDLIGIDYVAAYDVPPRHPGFRDLAAFTAPWSAPNADAHTKNPSDRAEGRN